MTDVLDLHLGPSAGNRATGPRATGTPDFEVAEELGGRYVPGLWSTGLTPEEIRYVYENEQTVPWVDAGTGVLVPPSIARDDGALGRHTQALDSSAAGAGGGSFMGWLRRNPLLAAALVVGGLTLATR